MRVSTLLDHIDMGHVALPQFQRGYVWNRHQVRAFMQSLYREYPVGGLLVWATRSDHATHRGDGQLAPGVVKLLLDGQQRITTLYGIIRGRAPKFFDGNAHAFTGLYFHLATETFEFYSQRKMDNDPLWIDVTDLMRDGIGKYVTRLSADAEHASHVGEYVTRLNELHRIKEREFPVEEVTDSVARTDEDPIDVVVDIFNRVNSGGTKLSKGDLALARICAEAPDARDQMKAALVRWRGAGYRFDLDWLLRNVNVILTNEARFHFLHRVSADEFRDGLRRAEAAIDHLLNAISGRLGLDHNRVFFGRYALPVMARYVDQRGGRLTDGVEQDRLLYWYVHAAMWGRFSGTTESKINRDLGLMDDPDGAIDRLIEELRLERGGLRVQPGHFGGWSVGARFYPVLYLLTRTGGARDWGNGLPLTANLLGRLSRLEVHHIFPKAQLYKQGYRRSEVNAVANFCLLTKGTNLQISATRPEVYFPEIEARHPGALASQWIPMDPELWKLENYPAFLEARRKLLANATNRFLAELLHRDEPEEEQVDDSPEVVVQPDVPGGIESDQEQEALEALNEWMTEHGLPEGQIAFDLVDEQGRPAACFDIAWPGGLQTGLTEPVAVLLNEGPETLAVASRFKFRFFTSIEGFKKHVRREVLAEVAA